MSRNITVTFDDGSTHVYQNAPDTITPDIVQKRAEAQFGKSVTNIDGGKSSIKQEAPPAPQQEQSMFSKYVTNPLKEVLGTVAEPAMQMASGFIAKPVSEVMGLSAVAQELMNPQGRDPEGFKNHIANALTYQPRTTSGKFITQNILAPIGGAIDATAGAGASALVDNPITRDIAPSFANSDIAKSGVKEALLQSLNFIGATAPDKVKKAIESSNAGKLDEINSAFNQPRIEAAKLAVDKYGLSLDPVVSNPNKMNTLRVTAAGQDHLLALIRRQNEPKVANILKTDIGIPENVPLTSKAVFDDVRNQAGVAKRQIQTMSGFADDGVSAANISALQPDALIGAKAASKKVSNLIGEANQVISSPNISGARLISEIENLRKNARDIYKGTDIKPTQRIVADTYMGIANELESLIERNLQAKGNTQLLNDFRDGRVRMAKAYSLESATDLNTGLVDPMKLAKMTARDNAITGAFADIGKIAGNFPESLGIKPGAAGGLKEMIPTRITRTGGGGTAGYLVGSAFGSPLVGAALGAGAGELFGNMYAKRLATNPSVQRAASIPTGDIGMFRKVAPYAVPPAIGAGLFSPYVKQQQEQQQ